MSSDPFSTDDPFAENLILENDPFADNNDNLETDPNLSSRKRERSTSSDRFNIETGADGANSSEPPSKKLKPSGYALLNAPLVINDGTNIASSLQSGHFSLSSANPTILAQQASTKKRPGKNERKIIYEANHNFADENNWDCMQCSKTVLYSQHGDVQACPMCGFSREESSKLRLIALGMGDWECSKCKRLNFRSKNADKCFGCGEPRGSVGDCPKAAAVAPTIEKVSQVPKTINVLDTKPELPSINTASSIEHCKYWAFGNNKMFIALVYEFSSVNFTSIYKNKLSSYTYCSSKPLYLSFTHIAGVALHVRFVTHRAYSDPPRKI